jgi:beta-glucosidase
MRFTRLGLLLALSSSVVHASELPGVYPQQPYMHFEAGRSATYAFPEGFLMGAASSAFQMEGGHKHSDWAAWERLGKNEGGAMTGAATDHWNRIPEDVQLMKRLGLQSYRFSIEWSRIEPRRGRIDREAVARYRQLVDLLQENGIEPMVTLLHFTLPKWLADTGGILAPDFEARFLSFAKLVVTDIAPRARYITTFNEPQVQLLGSYTEGSFPPGKVNAFKDFFAAEVVLLNTHQSTYKLLHALPGGSRRKVGLAQSFVNMKPNIAILDSWLTSAGHAFYNRSFVDALVFGEFKQGIPTKGHVHYDLSTRQHIRTRTISTPIAGGRSTSYRTVRTPEAPRNFKPLIDFLGVNIYATMYLKAEWFGSRGLLYVQRGGKTAKPFSHGGDLDPRALYESVKWMHKAYPRLPLQITETGYNGASDQERQGYILEALAYTSKAISEGVDIRGFQYWSFLDSFEWLKGWAPKDLFGLVKVDLRTYKRTPKDSAWLYKRVIDGGGFESYALPEGR